MWHIFLKSVSIKLQCKKKLIHKNYSFKNEIQSCNTIAQCVFLVKKVYELKEISLVQRAFRTE